MAPQPVTNGPKSLAKRARFVELLERYGISESRIHYTKSKDHYRGEKYSMYEDYLRRFNFPKDDVFLHDGGPAYTRDGVTVFDAEGFKTHFTYPTEVHQWLSPNDNNLHGCKEAWKLEVADLSDDPEGPLRLMQLIDLDAERHALHYFNRNIFHVTKSSLKNLMRG